MTLDKIKEIPIKNMKLHSFDVKSLFTNVPKKEAINSIVETLSKIDNNDLPIPKNDYLKLISLCINFECFVFNENKYKQIFGLPMGSPISPVAACLFMETLERDYFLRIMGRNSHWLRYIDDVLIITPNSTNMENKLRMINNVNINIQFTLESETNQELPFLDVRIIRTIENLQFKVYRKQTNKEDYIHYYSGHNQRIKTGVLIGFFLRAYRVCSSIYLEEELNHIIDMFSKLKYPLWTILKCKHKAKNIRETSPTTVKQDVAFKKE